MEHANLVQQTAFNVMDLTAINIKIVWLRGQEQFTILQRVYIIHLHVILDAMSVLKILSIVRLASQVLL